jgi:amino acid adenylation domain-containing protein
MGNVMPGRLIIDRDLVEEREYWVNRLAPAVGATNLATDYAGRGFASRGRAELHLDLGFEVSQKLTRLTRGGPFLIYTTLMTALKVCISKHTGSEIVVVGSPSLKEEDRQAQTANALAIVDKVEGDVAFRQLLLNVRQTLLDAYARQRYPFKQIVKELGLGKEETGCPLFNVALALEEIHTEIPEVDNDITITFRKGTGEIAGRVSYDPNLFKRETIERLAAHYVNALAAALENTDILIRDISILSEAERHQVFVEWAGSKVDRYSDGCAQDLFQAQAERSPDAVAVVFEERHLSYEELNRRANRLAHYLERIGLGPEALVGICVERSLEMVVGVLGILKAGAAYLPLDPDYPAERLAFMLDDAQAQALLTQKSLLERVSSLCEQTICLDSDHDIFLRQPADNPITRTFPLNLAYVIYTSGSTGIPKGVAVSHFSLLNLISWHIRDFSVSPSDHAAQLAALSFDAAVWEVWPCLCAGACLYLPTDDVRTAPSKLIEWLDEQGVTIIFLTTALAVAVMRERWPQRHSLSRFLTGGEKLHSVDVEKGEVSYRLYNNYGPTENTAITTYCEVRRVDSEGEEDPAIGRAIGNTVVYVVGRSGEGAGIGMEGELQIGGESLARGYARRGDLTAEKFIPNEHGEERGERLYRTGDQVRWRGNGEIEFVGRKDQQVKVRGHRIELGEIEKALSNYSAVKDAVVVAREASAGDKRLVAYLVPDDDQPLIVNEVRGYLKKSLPEYMIPSIFMTVDSLPLNANGKVDRRALPEPEIFSSDLEKAYVAPRTRTEMMVTAIWEQVLGIERIGIHHSFSELGGHSLQATQIMSRVLETFQVEVPLRRLFEEPTIAQLAENIEEALRTAQQGSTSPLKHVPRREAMPLSFAQQRLWFLDQFVPDSPLYNVPGTVRLTGVAARRTLEQSFSEVVRRHEALRTRFETREGEPAQIIDPASPVEMLSVDLSRLSDSERRLQAKELAGQEAGRPFNLETGPVLRTALLQLRENDQALLMTIHHIVCDEWSIEVLQAELRSLYAAYLQGQPSPLEELEIQYADYAAWQRKVLQGEALDQHMSYWKEQLAGMPALIELPTDRPRPVTQSYRGASQHLVINPDVTEGLKSLSRAQGVTLYTVLLAAYKVLLMRYSGQQDIVVGTPVSGRNRVEIERLIGFFVNTLALRSDLNRVRSFKELVKAVSDTLLEAQAHQEIPFEKLVEEMRLERSLSYSPLVQVMMAWQKRKEGESRGSIGERGRGRAQIGTAKFDLTLSMREVGNRIIGSIGYNSDLFDSSRIRRMEGHLQVLLEAIIADADSRLWELPILTEAEREQIAREWNDTGEKLATGETIQEVFEEQVKSAPESIAAVYDEEAVTYGELNRRANQLGRYLWGLGVGPEAVVGICLRRNIEMIAGLLGILKSGGVFLPLDPAYPARRLAYMLEDSQARVLVTETGLADELGEQVADVVCIDRDWDRIGRLDDQAMAGYASRDNLAYVIYTSGSTGLPKGVAVSHSSLLNLISWHIRAFSVSRSDHASQVAALSFDATVWEVWPCLCSGACLHLSSDDVRAVPSKLIEWLAEQGVTISFLPTPMAEAVIRERWPATHSLSRLLTGGDKLHRLGEGLGEVSYRLYNNYGPTENTVVTTYCEVRDEGEEEPAIGRPIGGTRVYVVGAGGEEAPIGVGGEVFIGGESLARGYMRRAEATAERFVPDWISGREGERLYRSGDLARYGADGELEYIGRQDHQVKLRGFRIELGEVEAALSRSPDVEDCVVVVQEDRSGDRRLVAYVVAGEESAPGISDLRRRLQEQLPDYMIPSAFVFLERLPLTANGKIDRHALPAPQNIRPDLETGYTAPATEIERIIAGIWQEALQVEEVGIHDNFFDLGGHSLLMMQVRNRVQAAVARDLSVVDLFKYPTIRSLAEYLGQQGEAESSLPQHQDRLEEEERLQGVVIRQQRLRMSYQAAMTQEGIQNEAL